MTIEEVIDRMRVFLGTPFLFLGMVFGWIGAKIAGMEFMADVIEIGGEDERL